RASHDEQLGRLEQYVRISLFDQVTAEDGGENQDDTEERQHSIQRQRGPLFSRIVRWRRNVNPGPGLTYCAAGKSPSDFGSNPAVDPNGGDVNLFFVLSQADRAFAGTDTDRAALGNHLAVTVVGVKGGDSGRTIRHAILQSQARTEFPPGWPEAMAYRL